ncbi:ATP-grasp domain-containing protein [Beggiatoa leptomitoformis]|uniref:ATP-grasp domain-containing protein n=1 Tax=Beggiatoa leptomitoformis TaxID=288004 RepID=A0A2N9YCF8_9GAMM|nr:ATP-grasp domain-containing protein [Beggiatoa leptomitoformis]ALG66573.1 ATP-grasp domain-containing protein [Beggiatoa leptomitoformis]AUI68124.2 ATP-grasp domain-containing protein [Beggiatoa leptomitoformis]
MNTPVLIAAVSARSLATAAHKTGLPVYVLDLYDDVDTQRITLASRRVKTESDGFDAVDLLTQAQELCPPHTPLVYGAGFEHCPHLLAQLARGRHLYGNSPDVVQAVKDPRYFFSLLKRLNIPHPETQLEMPDITTNRWLVKTIGGTGGYHVHPLKQSFSIGGQPCYYQRYLEGKPHSVLFLADGKQSRVVGYNEQWINEEFASAPYLYAGAMSVDDMPFQTELTEVVALLVRETGLRGLCGMDILLNATGFHVLEINPRPPSTFELHQQKGDLFYWHLQACDGVLPEILLHPHHLRAKIILYAQRTLKIPAHPEWPAWTADHPRPNSIIQRGEPICTVFAQGKQSQLTVIKREKQLQTCLKRWQEIAV